MVGQRQWLPFLPSPGTIGSLFVIATLIGGGFEWTAYQRFFHWHQQERQVGNQLTLFWLLGVKTLWFFLPVLLGAALLKGFGWRRAGWSLLVAGVVLVSGWLIVDLRIWEVTGNHTLIYLGYLGNYRPLEWIGNAQVIDCATLGLLTVVAVCVWLILQAGRWLDHRLSAAWVTVLAAAGFAFAAFGVLVTAPRLGDALLLERLEEALPVSLGWFEGTAGRGGDQDKVRQEFNRGLKEPFRRLLPRIVAGQPIDDQTRLEGPSLPNVVLLVLESLRAEAISPEFMPQLDRWANQGLRFERHYAGSNCSHFGLYGLLYGRTPLTYHTTLNAGIPPQMPALFRNSGYHCAYASSASPDYARMGEFINERSFDEVALSLDGSWPDRDRLVLRGDLPRLLRASGDGPRFIVSFIMSSHHEYRYPKEYERHLPVIEEYSLSDPNLRRHRERLFNRYRNALGFLDDELMTLLGKLDPQRNLIIVTGDHGESFWDDGRFLHASLGSDAQMHVPLVMVGPGVSRGRVTALTRHMDVLPTVLHALAGRHVPLARTHGHDVLVPGFQNDHLVLTPYRGSQPAAGLVLIRGDQRVRVRLWFGRQSVQMEGFSDRNDRLDDTVAPRPWEAEQWRHILLEELLRIAS